MIVAKTAFEGLYVIKLDVYTDNRGYFSELYNEFRYDGELLDRIRFVQDNVSYSKKNVIRGLHFQMPPFAQTKLVTCLKGQILDVAVDLRKNSPTFGKVFSEIMSGGISILIPKGFAHGFSVLSDDAVFSYKCDNYYYKDSECGIRYDDPSLHIDWKINGLPIVSEKDMALPTLADIPGYFE